MFLPFIISLILTILAMPYFIKFMHERQFGQVTREEGPAWHEAKSGTPAMGGVIFIVMIVASLLMTLIFQGTFFPEVVILILGLIFFGGIGFADDFLKIFKKQNEGLTSKQKFSLQILGSFLIILGFWLFKIPVHIPIPLFGELSHPIILFIFLLIWITGFSNAFNLTDGLDGLASGCGIISFTAYAWIAYQQKNIGVVLMCLAIVGGVMGFIFFNKKPAKIFMGDVGSLALGAVLAIISVILNNPWSLLLVGFIYIIETLSVMLQVTSYKLTRKRIFLMSPIHHHFEMKGWSEWKVDYVFWLIQAIASVIAIVIF